METGEKYEKLQTIMNEYAGFVYSSAKHILPFVDVSGKTLVDFGCGQGDWLRAARDLGACEVLGLDTYALEKEIAGIPTQRVDLTKPVLLQKRYDIALCLEVAEHLDGQYAATLIESLVRSAPVIVFSAAVPGQGGIHHVNEQPPAYWHALFKKYGYACYDFRREIWNLDTIEPWYRMGALVYCAAGAEEKKLKPYFTALPLHLVHPEIFEAYAPQGVDIILHYDKAKKRWYPEIVK